MKKDKIPIIVGGTGLYADSLIYGIEYTEINYDENYREYLMNIAETKDGLNQLYNKALEKQKIITGILKSYDNEKIVLQVDDKEISIDKTDISKMKNVYNWEEI